MFFMRICSSPYTEKMAALMGLNQLYRRGHMGCSHAEGITDGLVCDADIYGVKTPAEYLKTWVEGCSNSFEIVRAVKKIQENVKGSYACALEVKGNVYIFRDLIGIKPLYYQKDAVASEKKAFLQENCTPLLPGEVVELPDTTLHHTRIEGISTFDPHRIAEALQKSISQQIEPHAAVLFSGGIDSSILASLSDVPVITCGLEGSHDTLFSRKASHLLEKDRIEVVLTEKDITDALPVVLSIIEEKSLLALELALLMYFVCQEWDGKLLISGQGADELFGGYYKYEKAFCNKGDVKALMKKDFDTLYIGLERDGQVAERFDKVIRYPYLDTTVVRRALGIPAAFLFEPVRKGFLRKVASLLNLPEEIISRPKKALQYGTGIHKVVQNQYKKFLKL